MSVPTRGARRTVAGAILGAAALAIGLPLAPGATSAASAADTAKVHRIGYIVVASPEEQAHLTKAFEDGMRELGYVEGRNVVYERRFANGDVRRLPELAVDLVRQNPDVIVTGANPVIDAVKRATSTIPVVMGICRDPVGAGFVASYARPGGNITGLASDPTPEVLAKDLELFRELVPGARRVALLWNPVPTAADTYRRVALAAARRWGIDLQVVELRDRGDLESAFEAMSRERADGVWVMPDPLAFTARARVVALAARHRLPSVYWQREFVDAGGLISYGSNVSELFRRAAWYVDRILQGAKPGDLAVEQPAKFELVVNLSTAKALGLTVPHSLRLRADDVVGRP
jgi:putative ABC transport system substrate-binding protein